MITMTENDLDKLFTSPEVRKLLMGKKIELLISGSTVRQTQQLEYACDSDKIVLEKNGDYFLQIRFFAGRIYRSNPIVKIDESGKLFFFQEMPERKYIAKQRCCAG